MNELGQIAWGMVFAWFWIHRWGILSNPSIALLVLAFTAFVLSMGYKWGKQWQKKQEEKTDG